MIPHKISQNDHESPSHQPRYHPCYKLCYQPRYQPWYQTLYQFDIMLLKLAEHVDLKKYTPVCLPKLKEDFVDRIGWAYGEIVIYLFAE